MDYGKKLKSDLNTYQLTIEKYGENNPHSLSYLPIIALDYYYLEDYESFYEYGKIGYQKAKEQLGESNKLTLKCLSNLAMSLGCLQDYQASIDLYEECYRLYKDTFGEDDPDTLTTLNNLSTSYYQIGDYYQAGTLKEELYNRRKRVLGINHPDTLFTLKDLSNCYSMMPIYNDKALELSKDCYMEYVKALGENHKDTLTAYHDYIIKLEEYNREESVRLLEDCYQRQCKSLGKNHHETLKSLDNLSRIYTMLKQYDQALDYALECNHYFKNNTIEKFNILGVIGSIYYHLDDFDHSIQYFKQCMNHTEILFRNTNQLSLYALRNYLESFRNYYSTYKSIAFKNIRIDCIESIIKHKSIVYDIHFIQNQDEINNVFNRVNYFDLNKIQKQLTNKIVLDFYAFEDSYGLIIIKEDQLLMDYFSIDDLDRVNKYINQEEIVYICPEGYLYNQSLEPIIKQNMIYLSSTKSLMKTLNNDHNEKSIIFTNPDLDSSSDLPGARLQAKLLPDLLQPAILYEQEEFNFDHMCSIKDPRILHISTHGNYRKHPHVLKRPFLELSDHEKITALDLLHSISLTNTDLVYLDACMTGVSDSYEGEGIYGFRRVFELKGAKYIISTLTSINDINAFIFSKVFYSYYLQSENIEDAFFKTKHYLQSAEAIIELKEYLQYFENNTSIFRRKSYSKYISKVIELSKKNNCIMFNENQKENWESWILQKA